MRKFLQKQWKDLENSFKEKTWVRLYILVVVAFVLSFVLWYFGHFEVDLGITLAVVEVPLAVFGAIIVNTILRDSLQRTKEIEEGTRRALEKVQGKDDPNKRERIEKHKRDILQVLDLPATNGWLKYENNAVNYSPFQWGLISKDLLPRCKLHLKAYGNILDVLDQAKSYSDEKMNKIKQKVEEYQKEVDKKLETVDGIFMSDTYLGNQEHCNKSTVKQKLYNEIINILEQNENKNEQISLIIRSQDSSLMWGDQHFATGNKTILENIQNLINSLKKNNTIISIIREIIELHNQFENNTSLKEFQKQRNEIVLHLDKGQEDLRGECDLCPK